MDQGIGNNLRSVISLVDKLRDIQLQSYIQLPKIVVVGGQSSGKSSLIEQIVGIDFLPRGSGVVTRRPLEIRMIYDHTLKEPYAFFDEVPGKKFTNFQDVKLTIEELTDKVCGKDKAIIDKPIILNVHSQNCPNLTVIDLPGLTRIAVGGQSSDIYEVTSKMIRRYMEDPSSVILCVVSANQDITTDEVLFTATQIDPKGERMIGCLTKIDLMDRGTDARTVLLNKCQVPLKLGYVGIKNRSQADIDAKKTVKESLEDQKMFFSKSLIYSSLPPSCLGTKALTDSLTKVLESNIVQFLPKLYEEVSKRKNLLNQSIKAYGKPLPSSPQQAQALLWEICNKFLVQYKKTINGQMPSLRCKQSLSKNWTHVTEQLTNILLEQYTNNLAQGLSSEKISLAIRKFQGSNMPGFPSISSFYYLIDPLLKKLRSPLTLCASQVSRLLNHICDQILTELAKQFPAFCDFILDKLSKLIEGARKKSQVFIEQMIEAQMGYIYTNNSDFHELLKEKPQIYGNDELSKKNPMILELKKRVNIYYKITVKNLREIIPKNIKYTLVFALFKEVQFEIFQSCLGNKQQIASWLKLNTGQIQARRKKESQFTVICKAEQFLFTHPSFAKYRATEVKRLQVKNDDRENQKKKEKKALDSNQSPIRKQKQPQVPKDSERKQRNDHKNQGKDVHEIKKVHENMHNREEIKHPEKKVQITKTENPVVPQSKKRLLDNLFGSGKTEQAKKQPPKEAPKDLKGQYNKKAGQVSDKAVDQMFKNETFKKQSTKAVQSGATMAAQKQLGISQQNAAVFGKGAGWMFKQDVTQNYLKQQTKANVKEQVQIKK